MALEGTVSKRDPISISILTFAQRLADKADKISSLTHDKLNPVMQPLPPAMPSNETMKTTSQVYPPMFNELRERFGVIERALDSIEEALSRTEL